MQRRPWLWSIYCITVLLNITSIYIHIAHIAGVNNVIADCLSRFQQNRFRQLALLANPTRYHPCVADTVLHRHLLQCRYFGVAPSTRRTYQSGFKAFNMFCSQFDITTFPASSLTLKYFCAHASQHVSYKTLKVYLSSIRLAHIEQGLPDPIESATLHLCVEAPAANKGDNQRTRLPMTLQLLHLFGAAYAVGSNHSCVLWIFRASELLQTKCLTLLSSQLKCPSTYSSLKWTQFEKA